MFFHRVQNNSRICQFFCRRSSMAMTSSLFPSAHVDVYLKLRHSFGNLGRHPNANSLAGLRFRIEFGPQIDWKLGDGQTKELALYVDSMRSQACTCSGTAGSRSACGRKSPHGRKTPTCTQVHGRQATRLRNGERRYQMRQVQVGKVYVHSLF